MYVLWLFLKIASASDPVCAENHSQLQKTETLQALTRIVPSLGVKGFVNKTRGSYFFLKATDEKIHLTFLTTGIFDLYGIRRESEIRFCDSEGQLYIIGVSLGGTQKIFLRDQFIFLKDNSPIHTFESGPVPELLREKHDLSAFD